MYTPDTLVLVWITNPDGTHHVLNSHVHDSDALFQLTSFFATHGERVQWARLSKHEVVEMVRTSVDVR